MGVAAGHGGVDRRGGSGPPAAEGPVDQGQHHQVDAQELASGQVEGAGRHAAGGVGHDLVDPGPRHQRGQIDAGEQLVEVDPPDQALDVDLLDQPVDVDPADQGVDVDLAHQAVHVDLAHQRVHVHLAHQAVDVDLLDQSVDVDPPDQGVDVDAGHQGVEVEAGEHGIEVDAVEDRVEVESVEQRVEVDPGQHGIEVEPFEDVVGVDGVDGPGHDRTHHAIERRAGGGHGSTVREPRCPGVSGGVPVAGSAAIRRTAGVTRTGRCGPGRRAGRRRG